MNSPGNGIAEKEIPAQIKDLGWAFLAEHDILVNTINCRFVLNIVGVHSLYGKGIGRYLR